MFHGGTVSVWMSPFLARYSSQGVTCSSVGEQGSESNTEDVEASLSSIHWVLVCNVVGLQLICFSEYLFL